MSMVTPREAKKTGPAPRPLTADYCGGPLGGVSPTIDPSAARILEPYLVPRRFPAGAVLWSQGSHAGLLIRLDSGRVKAVYDQPDGSATLLYVFTPGDLFGFLPFVDGGPYPATAIAIDDVSARVMSRDGLRRVVSDDPQVALVLFEALGTRLRQSFSRVSELAQRRSAVRIAAALLSLTPSSAADGTTILDLPDPVYTFAEEVGVTPETFSRELKRFAGRGILHRLAPRRWQLLLPDRLRAIATGLEE